MEQTTNYNLKKPSGNDNARIADINENMDKIDVAIKGVKDTAEAKYTKPSNGIPRADLHSSVQAFLTMAEETNQELYGMTQELEDLSITFNSHKNSYVNHIGYTADTGTANAKTVTLNPVPTSYVDGMAIAFKNKTLNTGAVTINVNNLGSKSILKSSGSALTSGNLKANSIYTIRYNSSTGNFILQGEGGEYGTATASDVLTGKTIGTESGIVTGTLTEYYGAGTQKIIEINTNATTKNTYATKVVEFRANNSGVYRVSYSIEGVTNTSNMNYGQIWVNGVRRGMENTNADTSRFTYTEDITLNKDDLLQFYTWQDYQSSSTSYSGIYSVSIGIKHPTFTKTL